MKKLARPGHQSESFDLQKQDRVSCRGISQNLLREGHKKGFLLILLDSRGKDLFLRSIFSGLYQETCYR